MKQTVNVMFLALIVGGLWYSIGYINGWESALSYHHRKTEETQIEDE